MPHIRLTEPAEATGLLTDEYDAAIGRAGKVFNIVKAMSLRPERAPGARWSCTRRSCSGRRASSRQERELLATVVSRENDCHY